MATSRLAAVGSSGVSIGHHSSSSSLLLLPRQQQRTAASPPRRHNLRLLEKPPQAAPKGFGSGAKKKSIATGKGTTPTPPWLADASVCPCCSGRKFDTCCAPFLSGAALPQTAEQLMRSRFAAYVSKNAEYILRTTHPDNRAAAGSTRDDGTTAASSLAEDVRATIKRVSWQRLKVEGTEGGDRDDDEGFVTFTTWFKVTGQVGSRQDGGDAVGTMSERSRFVRRRVSDDDGGGGGNDGGEGEGGEQRSEKKRGEWSYREGIPVINGVPRVLS